MLGQRRRRWLNIKPALGQRLVFNNKPTHPASKQIRVCQINVGPALQTVGQH